MKDPGTHPTARGADLLVHLRQQLQDRHHVPGRTAAVASPATPRPRTCRACGGRIRLTWMTLAPATLLCIECALRDEDWPAELHEKA